MSLAGTKTKSKAKTKTKARAKKLAQKDAPKAPIPPKTKEAPDPPKVEILTAEQVILSKSPADVRKALRRGEITEDDIRKAMRRADCAEARASTLRGLIKDKPGKRTAAQHREILERLEGSNNMGAKLNAIFAVLVDMYEDQP